MNHLEREILIYDIKRNYQETTFIDLISREDKIQKIRFHAENSSIMGCAADTWNAIISSHVGMISVGGKMNPKAPISPNSMEYSYGIFASPNAQSAEPPDAVYKKCGICLISYIFSWVEYNASLAFKNITSMIVRWFI